MDVTTMKKDGDLQKLSEDAMKLFGNDLFNMQVISTDASNEILLKELSNLEQNADNNAQKTLLTSISHLSQPVKLELLQLIASLPMTEKAKILTLQKGGDDNEIVDYDEELPEQKKNKFLSNSSLFYSILGLFIGLTLLYFAQSNLNALKENYDIQIPGGFLSLLTNPKETGETLVKTVLSNLLKKAGSEIEYQTTRACTPQDGSSITALIQTLWDPSGVAKCVVDTGLDTAFIEAKRTAGEMSVTYNFIAKCIQVGTGMVSTFGGSTYYILDGRNDNKISRFIMDTVIRVPGLNKLLPSSETQLVIEDGNIGGKIKSRRRKTRKSKKTRKGKKGKKGKKGRKSRRKH